MGKPFIKLLHTIHAGYFYDVNRNEVIRVNEELYDSLKQDEPVSVTAEQQLQQLKELGYLSDHHPVEICHPQTTQLERKLNRCMQAITLQVTQQCNFRCRYCLYSESNNHSQRSHSDKVMSWETAKKALDFLKAHAIESPKITIGFYGGEPLLQFPLIRQVVEYANELFAGKELQFMITTNATLLNDEILSFMQENRFDVLISLDGVQKIHDKNRVFANSGKGTYVTVMAKLRHLYAHYPRLAERVNVNMVIDPSNSFEDINLIYKEMADMPKIHIMTNMVDDSTFEKPQNYAEQFVTPSEYSLFLNYLAQMKRVDVDKVFSLHTNAAAHVVDSINRMEPTEEIPDRTAPGGPCIPGQNRMLVTVEGKLFPCERVSEVSEATSIGDLENGLNMDRAKAMLNVGALTPDHCKNCWAFSFCTACVRVAEDGKALSAEVKCKHCKGIQNSAERKLREMLLISEYQRIYARQPDRKEVKQG